MRWLALNFCGCLVAGAGVALMHDAHFSTAGLLIAMGFVIASIGAYAFGRAERR